MIVMARAIHTVYNPNRRLRVVFIEDAKERIFFQEEKLHRLGDAREIVTLRDGDGNAPDADALKDAELWLCKGADPEKTFSSLEDAMAEACKTVEWLEEEEVSPE
jgi:hypothetical protein